MSAISTVDAANSSFWDHICGSSAAQVLGCADKSVGSLHRYDCWFMAYYSYLYNWLPLQYLRGKDVLEVGLGYGTMGQLLAASGANYTGLDIAKNPVGLMNERLRLAELPGRAVVGSILDAPFEDASFDHVVAIGCLHHTGDMPRSLREISRILRPGGRVTMMVYYAYSCRMIHERKLGLLRDMVADLFGSDGHHGNEKERAMCDVADGEAAPHTDFFSRRQLARIAKRAGLRVKRSGIENAAEGEWPFRWLPRDYAIKTYAKLIGTDLYATLIKK